MKILILTEGGTGKGFGHITRCIAISQAFQEKSASIQFIVDSDETTRELLVDYPHKLLHWQDKIAVIQKEINEADAIVVDSYYAKEAVYQEIQESKKTVICLDDYNRIKYHGDFVVNGSIDAASLSYDQSIGIEYLLGPKFCPLRKPYWDVPKKNIRSNLETVLVTLGGDDYRNLMPRILEFLNKNYSSLKKQIIIGKIFKNIKEIEKVSDGSTNLIYYPDVHTMKQLMHDADVAISATGQTLYELTRLGTYTLGICTAENQSNNFQGLIKRGILKYFSDFSKNNIEATIAGMMNAALDYDERLEIALTGPQTIDGQGARRIVQNVMKQKENLS